MLQQQMAFPEVLGCADKSSPQPLVAPHPNAPSRTAIWVVDGALLGPVLDQGHQRRQAGIDGAVVGQELGVHAGQQVVDGDINLYRWVGGWQ